MGGGRGDIITELPPLTQQWLVLTYPTTPSFLDGDGPYGHALSKTAHLYSMLSPMDYTDGSHTRDAVDVIGKDKFSQGICFNAFDRVALSAFPGLDQARQELLLAGAPIVNLSGSGPAIYTIVPSKQEGEKMLKPLKKAGLNGYCVSTVPVSPDLAH